MNKKIFLLLFVSMISFFTACDRNEDQHFESESDRLFHLYPEIEEEYNKVPKEIKEEMLVPKWDSIPFEVENVYLKYRENADENLPGVRLSYMGNSNYVSVSVWKYPKEKTSFDGMQPITLNQNIQAYYSHEALDIAVHWENPNKNDLLHHVVLTKVGENQDNGIKFTKADALEIANSALENDKKQ